MNVETISDENYLISSIQMYVLNITDDYDNIAFTNCTSNENEDNNSFKYLLPSIASSLVLLYLIFLLIQTLIKPLKNIK